MKSDVELRTLAEDFFNKPGGEKGFVNRLVRTLRDVRDDTTRTVARDMTKIHKRAQENQ